MTLEEFRRQAEIWGGDIGRWPQARQADARRIATTQEGRQVLSEAATLDRMVADAVAAVSDRRAHAAAMSVLARIAAEDAAPRVSWRSVMAGWFVPAGGMACAAALGIALALHMPDPAADRSGAMLVSAILDSAALFADPVVPQ